MALSYKARRRWALVILLIGLPVYVVLAISIINLLPRPNIIIEFVIYVALGIAWAFPFKFIFKGVGQADPEAEADRADPPR